MKLIQNPNLRVEDFPSEQSWIGRLFIQLNPLTVALNQIINGNIDYESNIKSILQSFSISAFQAFGIGWPFSDVKPLQVTVLNATTGTQKTPTVLLPRWSFDEVTRTITIHDLFEITSSGVTPLTTGSYTFSIRATV